MANKRKRKRKKRIKAELYQTENQTRFNYINYVWFNNSNRPVNDSIETIFHPAYAEKYFHPFYIMNAINCRLRA
ncbi:MAG: hypothetical protein R3321_01555 [Nitrososphaeraceae archaeon]|nr:hypothetical protein [Nitrososphaeraceae archaeon]